MKIPNESKPMSLIVGFGSALLLSIFGLWVTNVTRQMEAFAQGATERTAKIAQLETNQQFIKDNITSMDRKMDAMLVKLDNHMMSK